MGNEPFPDIVEVKEVVSNRIMSIIFSPKFEVSEENAVKEDEE